MIQHLRWGLLILVGLTALSCRPPTDNTPQASSALSTGSKAKPPPDPSDLFFGKGLVPTIYIEVSPAQEEKWREDLRQYVSCSLTEMMPNENTGSTEEEQIKSTYAKVAIKAKGAAGSYRELDDKPALTINMAKFAKGRSFHGLEKFHLNNSVQDESYLNEWLCSEISREMGVPAPRVSHAHVVLNERDLGLFVLKEGFDRPFLKRHFGDADGNLYDGGFLQDVDLDLEKDSGKGPDDHSDLQSLRAACEEADLERRWLMVENQLDVDAFLSFVALEMMTCHWDGYTMTKNNYRLYFHSKDGRARFLPHGMDQMFGDPGFPLFESPPSLVGRAVLGNPQWRAKYKAIIERSLPLFAAARQRERLESISSRLQPVVAYWGSDFQKRFMERVHEFSERVAAREPALHELLNRGEPMPLEFTGDEAIEISGWYSAQDAGETVLEELDQGVEEHCYSIICQSSDCVASWRRRVLLAPGKYRFEATLRTEGVEPIIDEKGTGAGIRISGGTRTNTLTADSAWEKVSHEFEVTDTVRDVELVIELRAKRGRLLIRPISRLRQVKQLD
jgi:hypothetical protein